MGRKIPSITTDARAASPGLVKVVDPIRQIVKDLDGDHAERRAVRGSEFSSLSDRVTALENALALIFVASDTASDVIGLQDTDDDTGANNSSTWETVHTFQLNGSGTIAVRINAWCPIVGGASVVQSGQARVRKNGIVVGAAENLGTADTNEEVWTPLKAVSSDIFDIQLVAGIQDNGGEFDAPSYIDWSEVRALVRYVNWS